jgi:hypothetical protein
LADFVENVPPFQALTKGADRARGRDGDAAAITFRRSRFHRDIASGRKSSDPAASNGSRHHPASELRPDSLILVDSFTL